MTTGLHVDTGNPLTLWCTPHSLYSGKVRSYLIKKDLPFLGISAETIPAFEASYAELLDALDIHFQHYPYLLGGHPSIADYGFMGPLYAHLARDPVPATLMKNRAPNVARWTERMNLASIADGEFPEQAEAWLPDDAIPETLEPVLRLLFQDWGAQLLADGAFVNDWLEANPNVVAGQRASRDGERRVHPVMGTISYPWRGVTVQRGSMPQGLWHFERGALLARALEGDARARFEDLVARLGGRRVMQVRLQSEVKREDNTLVFA